MTDLRPSPWLDPETPVDLTNCEREPIHIPGAIQPHGLLLALDAESDLSPGASTPASSDLDSTSRISVSPSLTSTSSIDDACPSPLRLPSPSTTPLVRDRVLQGSR